MITLASSCLKKIKFYVFVYNYTCLPQVDSTHKFSEDLPSKHEHGPGSQVYPKNHAHSAWTHHVLRD